MNHSKNFEKYKNYYERGLWTKEMLRNVMLKGKITEEEFEKIIGEKERA